MFSLLSSKKMEKQCYIGIGIVLLTSVATLGYKKYKSILKNKKNEYEKQNINDNLNQNIESIENTD